MDLQALLADYDARYGDDAALVRSIVPDGGYHSGLPAGSSAHHSRESLAYAIALLESGEAERRTRAIRVITKVITLQDPDPTSRTYGVWPMYAEEPLGALTKPDWNYADFIGSQLVYILMTFGHVLNNDLIRDLRAALGHAAWAIFRRNIGPDYTNIAFSGAAVAAAIGECLHDHRLVCYAHRRFYNILKHTNEHGGFNEYNSPGYAIACLNWCDWTLQLVHDEPIRLAAEKLRRIIWQHYAEHYHPATGQLAGPQSRDISQDARLQGHIVDYLRAQTGLDLVWRGDEPPTTEHPKTDARGFFRYLNPQPCPREIVPRFRSLPAPEMQVRHRYILRENDELSVWGTTWFTPDACLGSVNHEDLWAQRRTVLAYWRTREDPAVVFRVRFLHDGRDFASAYIRNTQRGPRVLSLVSLLVDRGDWHISLDRPAASGVFWAEDLRLRCELAGRSVAAGALDESRFQLGAGDYRMTIATAPGRFGPFDVCWELGEGERDGEPLRFLDAVCYHGPRRDFDFRALGEVSLGFGLELLDVDTPSSDASVEIAELDAQTLEATCAAGDGLSVRGPRHAHRYL